MAREQEVGELHHLLAAQHPPGSYAALVKDLVTIKDKVLKLLMRCRSW